MRLLYTPEALRDLEEIERYIRERLFNPSAASGTISRILDACAALRDQPYLGVEARRKFGCGPEKRCLLCGKHLILYSVREHVSIDRVLDTRTDYLRALSEDFSDK